MSDEEIPGRNLVKSSHFEPNWEADWKHDGTGFAGVYIDDTYGFYMQLNGSAQVLQKVTVPRFTVAQWPEVKFRLGCQYENLANGKESRIVVTTSSSLETIIDLSGIPANAEWNKYPQRHLEKMAQDDESLDITLHGPSIGGSGGLRLTAIICDVLIPPLRVKQLKLDNKEYNP
ncbi:hypothetical protein [Pseudomonas sp. MYb118]|uniref:hypothetical protein n=1 Tax=Pseudomonas sp. MYb118 TaxID=1848720 RepID=UPI0034CD9C89